MQLEMPSSPNQDIVGWLEVQRRRSPSETESCFSIASSYQDGAPHLSQPSPWHLPSSNAPVASASVKEETAGSEGVAKADEEGIKAEVAANAVPAGIKVAWDCVVQGIHAFATHVIAMLWLCADWIASFLKSIRTHSYDDLMCVKKMRDVVVPCAIQATQDIVSSVLRQSAGKLALELLSILAVALGAYYPRIHHAFCSVPGVTTLCSDGLGTANTSLNTVMRGIPVSVDFAELVDVQTKQLSQILDADLGTSALSIHITRAEMATTDLAVVVRYGKSLRPGFKDLLMVELQKYGKEARDTARGLKKWSAHVGGAIDKIVLADKYALISMQSPPPAPMRASWLPWQASIDSSQALEPVLARTYEVLTATLSREIRELIEDSKQQYEDLLRLERSLDRLLGIILDENVVETDSRDELLASIWTTIGLNKKELATHDDNVHELAILGKVTRRAAFNVRRALSVLEKIEDGLSELRVRTAAPSLLAGSEEKFELTLEAQVKLVEDGIRKLEECRREAMDREKDAMGLDFVDDGWGGEYVFKQIEPM